MPITTGITIKAPVVLLSLLYSEADSFGCSATTDAYTAQQAREALRSLARDDGS
jgi:hypothetical protein